MKKTIWVFGGISGVLISTFMGISMAMMGCDSENGGNNGMIIGFAAMIVAFSLIFVALRNFRDKQNGGTLTFGQGMFIGCLISLIASTLYVLTWAVEFHYYMPDFIDKYGAMQIHELQQQHLTPAAYEKAVRKIQDDAYSYKHNPFVFAAYTYMEILPVGILITLISSLILMRKPKVAGV